MNVATLLLFTHSRSLLQVMCVVFSIGGVTLVAIYSTNSKCGKHSSNNTHHHNSTHSPTPSYNDDCQEKSTVLGYVVSDGHMSYMIATWVTVT